MERKAQAVIDARANPQLASAVGTDSDSDSERSEEDDEEYDSDFIDDEEDAPGWDEDGSDSDGALGFAVVKAKDTDSGQNEWAAVQGGFAHMKV
jgi:hypothetical protein